MAKCMLTTVDNPYNPFTQWDAWFRFDRDQGYNSCGYLARIVHTSDSLSEEENDRERERATAQFTQGLTLWRCGATNFDLSL